MTHEQRQCRDNNKYVLELGSTLVLRCRLSWERCPTRRISIPLFQGSLSSQTSEDEMNRISSGRRLISTPQDPPNNKQVAPPHSANTTLNASRGIASLLGTTRLRSCYSIWREESMAPGNRNCVRLSNARLQGSSLNHRRCTMLQLLQWQTKLQLN